MIRKYACMAVVLLTALLSLSGFTANSIDYSKHPINFDLPINSVSKPHVVLTFIPPKGYVATNADIDAFIQSRTRILEYVPEKETLDRWTSIVTIILFINEKFQANTYTKTLVDGMMAKVRHSKIILENTRSHANYLSTAVALEYTTMEGSTELMYMVYYSGPYDSAGVQFTKKLDHWLEGAEAETEAANMQSMIESQLTVSD